MTPETEKRVIAFVRTVANRCKECLRRREENCRRCDSFLAASLLADICRDNPVRTADFSLFSRMRLIARTLADAGIPLLSSQIRLDVPCSPQLKQWTLGRMVRLGLVGRRLVRTPKSGRCIYCYFLAIPERMKQ